MIDEKKMAEQIREIEELWEKEKPEYINAKIRAKLRYDEIFKNVLLILYKKFKESEYITSNQFATKFRMEQKIALSYLETICYLELLEKMNYERKRDLKLNARKNYYLPFMKEGKMALESWVKDILDGKYARI